MFSLIVAAQLIAVSAGSTPSMLAQGPVEADAPPREAEVDEEEEEETEPSEPATQAESKEPPPPSRHPEEQRLVSGAPLFNPDVAVHIVERKRFADRGKHEVVLYPAAVQVNGKFTQHLGSALSYVYHLHENFGFQVTPVYNWFARESAFNQELVDKVKEQAQAATSLLLAWGAQAGVEVTPLYGKFAIYEGTLVHFSVVLNGGAGIASTRHQLKPYNVNTGPATFGDTGLKFLGSVGGGFRLQVGDRFALRFELRDLVYTARVDKVNGCNLEDLTALRANPDASVSQGCRVSAFSGGSSTPDIAIAKTLVETQSSDVLNNVGLYAGFGFLF